MGGKIYGMKKSKERQEEPLGTVSYQTSSKRLPPFWLLIGARKTQFSGTNQKPERRRPFGTGLVRHCPQGLFLLFFTFLRAIYFSAHLDFPSPPFSAPGSLRMLLVGQRKTTVQIYQLILKSKINLIWARKLQM